MHRRQDFLGVSTDGGETILDAAHRILDALRGALLGLAKPVGEGLVGGGFLLVQAGDHLGHTVGRSGHSRRGLRLGMRDAVGQRLAHARDLITHPAQRFLAFLTDIIKPAVNILFRACVAQRLLGAALILRQTAFDGAGQLGQLIAELVHAIALAAFGIINPSECLGEGIFQPVNARFCGDIAQRAGELGASLRNHAGDFAGQAVEAALQFDIVARIA